MRPRLATGYQLRSRGLTPVTDREMVIAGGGSVYSTTSDMARYAVALLGGGANEHGRVLRPETLVTMFEPHYQPDPRIPGMGLGFFRGEAGGHQTVAHDGIWAGFHSAIVLAPGEGIGVLVFTNTGPFSPLAAAAPAANTVLRCLLGLSEDTVRTDVPEHPWAWRELCGWYSFGPGVLTDPQPRMLGAGAEVVVRRSHLTIRGQLPVPAVRKGLRLYPRRRRLRRLPHRPARIGVGYHSCRVQPRPGGQVAALHAGIQPLSLHKQPSIRNPRPWAAAAVAAGATTLAIRRYRQMRAR